MPEELNKRKEDRQTSGWCAQATSPWFGDVCHITFARSKDVQILKMPVTKVLGRYEKETKTPSVDSRWRTSWHTQLYYIVSGL